VTAGLPASFGVGPQMAAGPLPARFRPTRDEPDEASAAAVAAVLAGQESQADEIIVRPAGRHDGLQRPGAACTPCSWPVKQAVILAGREMTREPVARWPG
jgi:hypothetical protein